MKLIRNTECENILSYFPGVDYPNSWTLENPAVYSEVYTDQNKVIIDIPSFNYLNQVKYLLFKVQGGVNYNINLLESNRLPYQLYNIYFYDYLHFDINDINNNENYFYYYKLGYEHSDLQTTDRMEIYFDYPKYVLMKITPIKEDSLKRKVKIQFSQQTLQFDYSAHYIIDWSEKVNGNCWSYTGKINTFNNLLKKQLVDNDEIKEDFWKEYLVFHASLASSVKNVNTGQRMYSYGDISYEDKQRKKSAYFNGNSYLYTNDKTKIPKNKQQRTITAWVMPQYGCQGDYVVSIGSNENNGRYGFGFQTNNRIGVYAYNNTTLYQYKYFYGQWIQISVTFKEGLQHCYVNGNLLGTNFRNDINTGNLGVTIGAGIGNYTHMFLGNISNVCIYNKAFNSEQIRILYERENQ